MKNTLIKQRNKKNGYKAISSCLWSVISFGESQNKTIAIQWFCLLDRFKIGTMCVLYPQLWLCANFAIQFTHSDASSARKHLHLSQIKINLLRWKITWIVFFQRLNDDLFLCIWMKICKLLLEVHWRFGLDIWKKLMRIGWRRNINEIGCVILEWFQTPWVAFRVKILPKTIVSVNWACPRTRYLWSVFCAHRSLRIRYSSSLIQRRDGIESNRCRSVSHSHMKIANPFDTI